MEIKAVPLLLSVAKESAGHCFRRILEGPNLRQSGQSKMNLVLV